MDGIDELYEFEDVALNFLGVFQLHKILSEKGIFADFIQIVDEEQRRKEDNKKIHK